MDSGNTAMILAPFIEGMKTAGAEVDAIYTKKLKIEPCSGDMSCWFAHPGECGKDDDMKSVLPMIKKADSLVWASPVYYAGVTGPMKNLMDRQLPIHLFGSDKGRSSKKVILVSTCSVWGMDMFEPLISQMRALYGRGDSNTEFTGALLRPHAQVMMEMMKAGEAGKIDGVLAAARDAGRQIVEEGSFSDETLRAVRRELISEEVHNKAFVEWTQQVIQSMKDQKEC